MDESVQAKREVNQYDKLFSQIPDKVKYSSVEKFFRNAPEPFNNVEITRRIFTSYIKNGILPETEEANRVNDNFTLYTKEQIIYFYLAQKLKSLTKLENISKLFSKLRSDEIGFTAQDIYGFFDMGTESLIEEIKVAIFENIKQLLSADLEKDSSNGVNLENELEENKDVLFSLILLVMAKCCIDGFNEYMKKFDKGGLGK